MSAVMQKVRQKQQKQRKQIQRKQQPQEQIQQKKQRNWNQVIFAGLVIAALLCRIGGEKHPGQDLLDYILGGESVFISGSFKKRRKIH